ncbi:MAG: DUF4249 domain-containing protein [Bacteroides sp.]|nr:DUF4249 domain-containing protein [Bacteroides sp.]
MKKKYGILTLLLSQLLLPACVEEFEANVGQAEEDCLVVEGNIVSDSTVVFYLSRTVPIVKNEENEGRFDSYKEVTATVAVTGSDGQRWEGRSLGEGAYSVEVGTLDPEEEYCLVVKYNDEFYTSTPQRPLAPTGIERLSFKQAPSGGDVTIHVTVEERRSDEVEYYQWIYEEDWEVRSEYPSDVLYEYAQKRVVNYDKPPYAQGWCYVLNGKIQVGTSNVYEGQHVVDKLLQTIPSTDDRISHLYCFRVTQRNLSREEYEYLQLRAKLDSEMGGLFTPQPSELPTNITCRDAGRKVIGYVGCNMGVAHARLFIDTKEVIYQKEVNCALATHLIGSPYDNYMAGYNIAYEAAGVYYWARKECVDVRSMDADPNGRPEWWPNPYLYK